VAGPLVDRFDRRRLLLVANLVEAALTVLMVLAALAGEITLLQAIVLARGAVGAFVVPAEAATLRRVVAENELVSANALLSATWSVTYVAGMAAGGALAALDPAVAMALDAVSFLVAAILLRPLPALLPEGIAPRAGSLVARVPADLREALAHARGRPELFRAVFAKAPLAVAGGGGLLLLNLVADRRAPFGGAALSLGLLQAVRGVGTGVGPMLAVAWMRQGGSSRGVERVAVAVALGAMAAFALGLPAVLLLPVVFAWGMGTGSNWVLSSADIQRLAPDRFMGRLAAIDDLGVTLGQVAGALAGGAVADAAGLPAASAWVALVLGGVIAVALLRPVAPGRVAGAVW
jgi:MFS family permease